MARTEGATAPRRTAPRKAEQPNGTPKPAPVAQASPKPAPRPKPNAAEVVKTQSVIALRTESAKKLYRETVAEMQKINWPDRQTTRSLTILVIGISVVLGVLLGGIDYLLLKLLQSF